MPCTRENPCNKVHAHLLGGRIIKRDRKGHADGARSHRVKLIR
jgi:hypothetical protein